MDAQTAEQMDELNDDDKRRFVIFGMQFYVFYKDYGITYASFAEFIKELYETLELNDLEIVKKLL